MQKAEAEAERIRQEAQKHARDIVKGVEEAMIAENRHSQAFIRESTRTSGRAETEHAG